MYNMKLQIPTAAILHTVRIEIADYNYDVIEESDTSVNIINFSTTILACAHLPLLTNQSTICTLGQVTKHFPHAQTGDAEKRFMMGLCVCSLNQSDEISDPEPKELSPR